MRHAASSSIRLAPVLSALIVPACFSLPKADVSTHVIDDFAEDAGLTAPTWDTFRPWTCEAFTILDQDNGDDAGPDGGPVLDAGPPPSPDGGSPVTCALGPGATTPHGLAATFDLALSNSNLGLAVATSTSTEPGTTVDFTGFKYFQFSALLHATPRTNKLPPGTSLAVELRCPKGTPKGTTDVVASAQKTGVTVDGVGGWSLVKLNLTLTPTDFAVMPASESIAACLGNIDRIRFKVTLPASSSPIAGTLELDDIELTNDN